MHYRLCLVTVHIKVLQNGRLVRFSKRPDFCVHLVRAFVIETAPLVGVSRAAVSKVMMAYTNHGKTSSAKRNSGQKPKLSERECHLLRRIV